MDMQQHHDDIEMGALDVTGGTNQYLTFILADEEYGVDILKVQEVRGWDTVTPMPNTPRYIKGVINLRGMVVPIVDLRERFGIGQIPYGPRTVVIVLKIGKSNGGNHHPKVMGIVVDAVSDVYNVAADQLRPPPDFSGVISSDFVAGLATVDEKMVILINSDKLLSVEELTMSADKRAASASESRSSNAPG